MKILSTFVSLAFVMLSEAASAHDTFTQVGTWKCPDVPYAGKVCTVSFPKPFGGDPTAVIAQGCYNARPHGGGFPGPVNSENYCLAGGLLPAHALQVGTFSPQGFTVRVVPERCCEGEWIGTWAAVGPLLPSKGTAEFSSL
jgi:hypothetical protein